MRAGKGARGAALWLALALGGCSDAPERTPATTAEILAARGAGEAFLQQDRLVEASDEFQRLVDMAPDEPAGYTGLGLIALRDGRFDDAERWLEEARSRAREDPELTLALARLRQEAGDTDAARALLTEAVEADPSRARAQWLLAEIEREAAGEGSDAHLARLRATLDAAPGNFMVRIELADALLAANQPDAALAELEAFRQVAPDVPADARPALDATEDAIRDGAADEAARRFDAFRERYEVTTAYQADAAELLPPPGRLVGIPFLGFSSADNLRVIEQEAVLAALRYADASQLSGFAELAPAASGTSGTGGMAVGDYDGDGDEDVLWLDGASTRFLRVDLGRFVDASDEAGSIGVAAAGDALFVDLDDDRRLDVYLGGADVLFARQLDDGTFTPVSPGAAGVAAAAGAVRRAIAADLDQDGDLDVFEAREGANRFLRNDGDWTFTELAATAGLAGPADADTRDVAFADLDDDRDLDLVLAEGEAGLRVLRNLREGRFEDATAEFGLGSAASDPAYAVGLEDVDNDGRIDLIAAAPGELRMYRAAEDSDGSGGADGSEGRFAAPPARTTLPGLAPAAMGAFDFDNDGWIDVALAGARSGADGSGLALLRNEEGAGFGDASSFLPAVSTDLLGLRATDYNDDGDSDLVLLEADGGLALLRNDGGNANHFLRLDLMGLGEGSRKNNRFAIGARVEVRIGDTLQVRTVRTPSIRFGLDGRLKADVVRVEWPNGVAQDLFFPGTDQDLIEQQSLKGSCPLLYVWNGEGYQFVGDVMWKSALGMPLGILGAGRRAHAPAFPSQEYRRLPTGVLQPRDGEYVMQLTEELWETIYIDDVDLVAVDHPDSVDVYVDERFVPPAPTALELWRVGERRRAVSAVDGEGRDQLGALAVRDDAYVSSFRAGRFQGIAEPHELILDLGEAARGGEPVLYLTGWIFPTDASINVALAQSDDLAAGFPALDVIGPDGEWVTAIEDLSFPSGKDKTLIADLRGLFPTDDRRVRIRTNLMIYWDEAFFTVSSPEPGDGVSVTRLAPSSADFHFRGFSREYRKGGRYGPHWFDYETVTTRPRWSDLAGTYTRYGDVTELVQEGDDMYIVANAGDEVTLRFDAGALPPLAPGWTRTFLIYTDGWVKDGDLNTSTGDRVEPLPFRAQTEYPYGPGEAYPDDPEHRRYLEEYHTRRVRPRF